jgi:hypothetical protein
MSVRIIKWENKNGREEKNQLLSVNDNNASA